MTTPPSYQPDPNHQYAPSDTQAISVGDPRFNGNGMAPGQHPKVKQLLNLTLGSAAAFILCNIVSTVLNSTKSLETASSVAFYGGVVAGILILAGLYFLVYSLISKGKNAGRITGIVFCILGLCSAAWNIFSGGILVSAIFYAIAAIINILWLIKAFDSEVSANLV